MGAPTETYIDPAIAGNSGTGTIGDPYGDVQFALDSVVRDAVNGDRMNVKAGTDEILTAALDLTAYGVPALAQPLIFQGYTNVVDDGGTGGIEGDAGFSIIGGGTIDYISFIDMHCHNSGANPLIDLDNEITLINCEFDTSTSNGVLLDNSARVISCHFHDISPFSLQARTGGHIAFNMFESSGNRAIDLNLGTSMVLFNIFDLSGGADGIVSDRRSIIIGNSIYSAGGTGDGIAVNANQDGLIILNNILEGFSGVGGVGIAIPATAFVALYGYNAFFNNATNLNNLGSILIDDSAQDQILIASPFTDASSDDFTVKTTVQALAYPIVDFPNLAVRTYLDIGALQREEAGGGRRSRIRWHGV